MPSPGAVKSSIALWSPRELIPFLESFFFPIIFFFASSAFACILRSLRREVHAIYGEAGPTAGWNVQGA